ncbi:MAG TPA: hypothetical protein VIX84_10240, partial [Acidimicrobiales bacterium]
MPLEERALGSRNGTVGVGNADGDGTRVLGMGRELDPGKTGVGPGMGVGELGAPGALGNEPAMTTGSVTLPS